MNSESLALGLPSPAAPLSGLGWGKRILLLVGFLLALQLAVAGIAVFAILRTSGEAKLTEAVANERIAAAVAARQAVLDLDRNQMRLIAADEPEAIRKAAVASIRGGSNLDESFARLAKSFGDHPRVARLVQLSEALKEPRMAVIAAAKKNDDADAFAKVEALAPKIEAIDSLSAEILAAEQRALAERLSENVRQADALTAILAAVSLGGLALGLAAGVLAARALTRPLERIAGAMHDLAEGRLAVPQGAASADEVGRVWSSLARTARSWQAILSGMRSDAEEFAAHAGRLGGIAQALNAANTAVTSLSARVAARCAAAAASAGASGEALTAMAATFCTTADAARSHADRTQQAAQQSTAALDKLSEAVTLAERLRNASNAIHGISGTVATISQRTGLLALNAAIEAARAGEAGRGFAVVSEEVRALADQSRSATDEIAKLTQGIGVDVEAALAATGAAHDTIRGSVRRVVDLAGFASDTAGTVDATRRSLDEVLGLLEKNRAAIRDIEGETAALADDAGRGARHAAELSAVSGALTGSAAKVHGTVSRFSF